jgi:hypothetical protein
MGSQKCWTILLGSPLLCPTYAQQKAKGKSHQSAVRALAYKWIRILFKYWKMGIAYDKSKYLNTLKKRGSPLYKGIQSLLNDLGREAVIRWKSIC